MPEQQVVESISIFQMITWSGLLGVISISVASLILVISPILYACLKTKRLFILWLMKQAIAGNLIISLFIFASGILKMGMTYGRPVYGSRIVEEMISYSFELLPACTVLIFISLVLFLLRFSLIIGFKLKK